MNIIQAFLLSATMTLSGSVSPANPMPEVVRAAYQHAHFAVQRYAPGPVLVDVESFAAASRQLGVEAVSERQLLAAAGEKSRRASASQAVLCDVANPNPGRPGCRVADQGLYIKSDSIAKTSSGFDAFVTVKWTERRRSGAVATGSHTLRLSFASEGGQWRMVRNAVYRQS